jgi:hypothetical protein
MKLHERFSSVGSPTIRSDGHPKVTGATHYTADHNLPGMIWGKCLRSPLPHARIRRIDVQKAKKTKGVFAVLTASGEEGESGCQFPWLVRLSRKSGRSLQCGAEAARKISRDYRSYFWEALISRLCLKCHGAPVVLPKSTGLKGPRRLVMLFTNQCRRVFYYVARPPLLADFLHTRFVHRGPDPHFFIKLDGARMIGDRKVR